MSEINNTNRRNSPPAVNARLSGLSSLVYSESSTKNTYIKEDSYVLKKPNETHSNERASVGFFPLTPNTSGRERYRLLAVGYVGRIPLLGLTAMPFTGLSRPKGFQPSAIHLYRAVLQDNQKMIKFVEYN